MLIKTATIISLVMMALVLIPNASPTTISVGSPSIPQLSIVKLHTGATGISACNISIAQPSGQSIIQSGTLFGNIRIVLNITVTNTNATLDIHLNAFSLVVTQPNQIVANVTNTNQHELPTNVISDFVLNPNIPVILILSFAPVCVTSTSVARLVYFDSVNSLQFNLP